MVGDPLMDADRRVSLAALRDLLIERVRVAEPKETAPLAKQLADVLATLESLPGEEKSRLDELVTRRRRLNYGGTAKPTLPQALHRPRDPSEPPSRPRHPRETT